MKNRHFKLVTLILSIGMVFSMVACKSHEHKWSEWETIITATCSHEGKEQRTCLDCDEIETRSIEKTEHRIVIDERVEPDCIHTGLTEGSHCEVCGEIIVAQQVIPATGEHHIVIDKRIEPTCVSTGLTEGSHCEVCGEIIVPQEIIEIDPEKHKVVVDSGYATTALKNGMTSGSHCELCGEVFVPQEVLPASKGNLSAGNYMRVAANNNDNDGYSLVTFINLKPNYIYRITSDLAELTPDIALGKLVYFESAVSKTTPIYKTTKTTGFEYDFVAESTTAYFKYKQVDSDGSEIISKVTNVGLMELSALNNEDEELINALNNNSLEGSYEEGITLDKTGVNVIKVIPETNKLLVKYLVDENKVSQTFTIYNSDGTVSSSGNNAEAVNINNELDNPKAFYIYLIHY